MSWEDEVKRRDAKPVVCIEVLLDSGTLYYADRDFREDEIFWEGRVLNVSPINRGVDLNGNSLLIDDVTVTFHNNDPDSAAGNGHFGPLLPPANDFENATVNIYLKFIADDGAIYSKIMFSGLCIPGKLNAEQFTMSVRPAIRDRVNLVQRSITETAFPEAPPDSIGLGQNIILGKLASENGTVFCPMIDSTSDAEKFCVAQHAVAGIYGVYRKRNNAITKLTSGYTINTSEFDDDENPYSYIQLGSGQYLEGDEIYADVSGLLTPAGSYIDLNGTSEYYYLPAGDTVGIPGHDYLGSFTVEYRYQADQVPRYGGLVGVRDDSGTSQSWLINQYGVTNQTYIIVNTNAGSFTKVPGGLPISAGLDYVERWVVDFENDRIKSWRDSSLILNETLPTEAIELVPAAAPFRIGAYANLSGTALVRFDGRIYYCVIAKGAQELPDTASSYRDGEAALENIISEWHFDADGRDVQSRNNLIPVSISGYHFLQEERNPVFALRKALIQFTSLTSSDISEESFNAAAELCKSRNTYMANGYEADGQFGAAIPRDNSGARLESEGNPWEVFQSIAKGFDHQLFVTTEGKIGLASIDIQASGTPSVSYAERTGDFSESGIEVDFRAVKTLNERRLRYRQAHAVRGGTEAYIRGYNKVSKDTFGKLESEGVNRVAQKTEIAKDVLIREMHLSSGRAAKATWNVPGLWGLQAGSEIGDYVTVTHARALSGWESQPLQIVEVSTDLMSGTVQLSALGVGSAFFTGTVGVSEEVTDTFTAEIDTYIDENSAVSSFGSHAYLWHGEYDTQQQTIGSYTADIDTYIFNDAVWSSFGTLSYMWHGEWAKIDEDELPDHQFEQLPYRCAYRFNLSGLPSSAVIQSASLQMYIEWMRNSSSLELRQLTNPGTSPAWSENSTAASFRDGLNWHDAWHIGSKMSDAGGYAGVGYKTFSFNSAGINYLRSQHSGAGYAHFTHNIMYSSWLMHFDEGQQLWSINYGESAYEQYKITSSEGLSSRRPQLAITYTETIPKSFRGAYRFDIGNIPAGSTIQSASLEFYVEGAVSPTGLQVRQLLSTAWSENSTWNNFDGSAWSDSKIGGTILSDDTGGGMGSLTKALNSQGIAYLQGLVGGTGLAQITHQMLTNSSYKITSSEGLEARKPKLTITYITP